MFQNSLLEKDCTKEFDACEEYNEKLISIKQKVKEFFGKPDKEHLSQNVIEVERKGS